MADTIVTPNTNSTQAVYATLRDAINSYVYPPNGLSVASALGNDDDRVFVRAAPSPAPFPYITLRLTRVSSGAYNGYREECVLEVQVIGRPASQLPLVMQIADLIDGCFLGYAQPNSGLMFSRQRQRNTLPQFQTPADNTVVGEQMLFDVVIWPLVLLNLRPNP